MSLDTVRKSVTASVPLNCSQPQSGSSGDDLLSEIIKQIASIPVVQPCKKESVSLRRPTEPRQKSTNLTKDQKQRRKVASMKRLENKKLLLKEKM